MSSLNTDMMTGIICRGVLLGYAKFDEQYRDKQGAIQTKTIHALGFEKLIKGRFGEERHVTQQVLVPDVLVKNSTFMNSVGPAMNSMVEIQLSGYSDFNNRPYASNEASLVILP